MKPDTIVQFMDDSVFWALWKLHADSTSITLGHIVPGFRFLLDLFLISGETLKIFFDCV